jgi:hypothetical protein
MSIHLRLSALMSVEVSGVLPTGSKPSPANLIFTSSLCSASAISRCTLRTISGGVPARTTMPYHDVTSKPGKPLSATVGTSGNWGLRVEPAMASATSLPLFTCCRMVEMPANIICTLPPSKSFTAGAMPLYGTWTVLMPASKLRSSPAKCAPLPSPGEAKLSLSGFALAYAISSRKVFAGTEGCTTRTLGDCASSETGVRSRCVSNGSLGKSVGLTVRLPAGASSSV